MQAMDGGPGLLGVEAARRFWDQRHRDLDDLRSGGDTGFDRAGNEVFYAWRLGLLLHAIGDVTSVQAPLRVLDAGCGKGWFARAIARCGHVVDAIDVSVLAIEEARTLGGGPHYEVATLAEFRSTRLYDVVFSIDVLFHLLDDAEWATGLRNLASLVRLTGKLVVSDWVDEERRQFGCHQLVRPPSAYVELLTGEGLQYERTLPYAFRSSRVGLHVFVRTE